MRLPGQPMTGLVNLSENMYLIVRSLKRNNEKVDYDIQEKDILKIGRVKFAVKKIGLEKPLPPTTKELGLSANSIYD